ncbi:MAG: hypothetical protein U5K43_12930 [Halofilum sp. (in: g-proteobacteria)]|nr:hypothetical protein [Halofilum sp. (in: g-proteobacteria)]
MTTMCATLFFVTSLGLAVMAAHRGGESPSVMDTAPAQESAAQQSGGDAAGGEGAGGGDMPAQGGDGEGDLPPIDEQ